jgi:thioredoxin-related protein
MKFFIILLTSVFLMSCGGGTDKSELPVYATSYVKDRSADEDLKFAIADATEQNKRIMVIVGGDWCPWCNAMDKFLNEEESDIGDYLYENFVVLKVYYGPGNYNSKFFSAFPKLIATPHIFVLESDGSLLYSQGTAELEKGRSYDKLKYKVFLQKWLKKDK